MDEMNRDHDDHRTAILALLELPRIGTKRAAKFISSAEEPLDTEAALLDILHRSPAATKMTKGFTQEDIGGAWSSALEQLDHCDSLGIQVLGPAELPPRLAGIPEAPLVLYVKGGLEPVLDRAVAVIGTREPSDTAKRFCHDVAEQLASRGVSVVSGLAFGCDTAGHRGAVQAGGHTVAVLAHGLDTVSPKQQTPLAEEILESDGALVSEYPPGTGARGFRFVERDRIQAGLSACVIVGETSLDGGSMHAVRAAREAGRPVLAYHPDGSKINREMIEEGFGEPVESAREALNRLRAPGIFNGGASSSSEGV